MGKKKGKWPLQDAATWQGPYAQRFDARRVSDFDDQGMATEEAFSRFATRPQEDLLSGETSEAPGTMRTGDEAERLWWRQGDGDLG